MRLILMKSLCCAVLSLWFNISSSLADDITAFEGLGSEGLFSHYMAAALNSDGTNKSDWNHGKGLIYDVKNIVPQNRFFSRSYIDIRRGLVSAGNSALVTVGIDRFGKPDSTYQGSFGTLHTDVKAIVDIDLAFAAKTPRDGWRDLSIAGNALDSKKKNLGIVLKRYYTLQADKTQHFYGENGSVLITPDQVSSASSEIKLLGIFANLQNETTLVVSSKENVNNNVTYKSYLVKLHANGTIISSFGENGIVEIAKTGGPFLESATLHRAQFLPEDEDGFYLSRLVPNGIRSKIVVSKYRFSDGQPANDFTDIQMFVDVGKATQYFLTFAQSKLAIVAYVPNADKGVYLIGMFSRMGNVILDFSGDGKRFFKNDFSSWKLNSIALTNSDRLYFIYSTTKSLSNELVVTRRLVNNQNQGILDRSYGFQDGQAQLNYLSFNTRTGRPVSERFSVIATNSIVEELANGNHQLIITGGASILDKN